MRHIGSMPIDDNVAFAENIPPDYIRLGLKRYSIKRQQWRDAMNKRRTDKTTLDDLVESLEQHEAERALESLRSGSQFDAGIVEGISTAIDKLDSARTSAELQTVVQDLTSVYGAFGLEDETDAYAKGIAAGTSHVAGVVREELESIPEHDF
jgi:hypothetical protein